MVKHRYIRFHSDRNQSVVDEMIAMAKLANGSTWLNITPDVDDEQAARLADRSGVAGWFSGRGSDLPTATFVPANLSGRRPVPASIGVQHGFGSKALAVLNEANLSLPDGWVKQQDNGKRGLVADVPVRIPVGEVLDYLTSVATVFMRDIEFGGWFVADISEI